MNGFLFSFENQKMFFCWERGKKQIPLFKPGFIVVMCNNNKTKIKFIDLNTT